MSIIKMNYSDKILTEKLLKQNNKLKSVALLVPEPVGPFPDLPPMSLRMNRSKPLTLLEKLEVYYESNCSRK